MLERWDNIDGYLVKKLLEDPRFPSLPTSVNIRPAFNEPDNWGKNYGSRIRGYFVPEQNGPHIFSIGIKQVMGTLTYPVNGEGFSDNAVYNTNDAPAAMKKAKEIHGLNSSI